jgi:hypothetical protein
MVITSFFHSWQGKDLLQVIFFFAIKRKPDKNKNRHANETKLAPSTVQIGDTTFYLNKGETINFQGDQYSSHMTKFNYRIGQHIVTTMEYALIDRGEKSWYLR